MRRHFTIWYVNSLIAGLFLVASNLFADSTVFTGKLIRKYYLHLIPQAEELGVFGWFLELDPFSKVHLQEKIATLSEEDRKDCTKFEFDTSIVQVCLSGTEETIMPPF